MDIKLRKHSGTVAIFYLFFFANFPVDGGAKKISRPRAHMLLNIFQADFFLKLPREIYFSADWYGSDIYPANTATS